MLVKCADLILYYLFNLFRVLLYIRQSKNSHIKKNYLLNNIFINIHIDVNIFHLIFIVENVDIENVL